MILVEAIYQNVNILRSIALCMSFDYMLHDQARVELRVDSRHDGLLDVAKLTMFE